MSDDNEEVNSRPLGKLFNVAVNANTNFFPNLPPVVTPTIFRVYICLSQSAVFSVIRTNTKLASQIAGNNVIAEQLNGGNPLTANAAYMFDIMVDQYDLINFQSSIQCTILNCSVVEKDLE